VWHVQREQGRGIDLKWDRDLRTAYSGTRIWRNIPKDYTENWIIWEDWNRKRLLTLKIERNIAVSFLFQPSFSLTSRRVTFFNFLMCSKKFPPFCLLRHSQQHDLLSFNWREMCLIGKERRGPSCRIISLLHEILLIKPPIRRCYVVSCSTIKGKVAGIILQEARNFDTKALHFSLKSAT
jgi:hypothetical protein